MAADVLRLEDVRAHDIGIAGGKGANLGELLANGFPVPAGFVISSHAGHAFLREAGVSDEVAGFPDIPDGDLAVRCAALQRRILQTDLAAPLAHEIRQAHARLMEGQPDGAACAVRSSATAEDLAGASFAGQHGTYYYVDGSRLLEMVRHCWASLWSPEAASYRASHGIPHGSVRMAVVVQRMVRAEVSGVAFTANPVTGARDEVVIESSFGMGAAIVDGRVTPDHYIVARYGLALRERRIAEKRFMVPARPASEQAARLVAVPHERRRRQTLARAQIETVARSALHCEALFGTPQDVEWAFDDAGRFQLLQSRPITTLGSPETGAAVKGKWVLFKAIAENFTDPITPLTVDLLSLLLGPGLRFIGGRLYVNLAFLGRLVPFAMSDEDLAAAVYLSRGPGAPPLRLSLRKLPAAILAGLLSYLVLGVVLARTRGMPDGFMEAYRALCREVGDDPGLDAVEAFQRVTVLPRMLDPIGRMALFVNVASLRFAPWMAALRWMLQRWLPELRPEAVTILCSGSDGVLSTEMGRSIRELAGHARGDAAVRDVLLRDDPEAALLRLREDPAARGFIARLDGFLAVHGHRAIKELELRSARWAENPAPVLGMVRNHLLADIGADVQDEKVARERRGLEAEVGQALKKHLLAGWLVRLAARRSRYYLKLRENSRFYHIMAIGLLRKRVLAIEETLLADGRLRCRDDIFFLLWNEVALLRAGRLDWVAVEERIRQRRLEHVRLAKRSPPRTVGVATRPGPADAAPSADRLHGRSASPGFYEGVARVVLDPSVDATLRPGEVLIAPYTDPAWTPLFLTAGAAVVEVGSYLSHAGTVAREYGLPCVVDVADCTRRIQTGMRVSVDGGQGVVRILDPAAT